MLQSDWLGYSYTISHHSSPQTFPLSSLVKTDHMVRSRAGTICHIECPRATIRRKFPLSGNSFLLDKMKRTYRPMSNLVRREQEKFFFRLKTAVNSAGAEVSRFEVPL